MDIQKKNHHTPLSSFFTGKGVGIVAWNFWGIIIFFFVSCEGEKIKSSGINLATQTSIAQDKKAVASPLHPDILTLKEWKKMGSTQSRAMNQILGTLPAQLATHDALALMEILKDMPVSGTWEELTWAAFVNNSLNLLCSLETLPPHFVETLNAINADISQPLVLRDYALQHLGALAISSQNSHVKQTLTAQDRQIIKDCVQRNRRQGAYSLAGTALNISMILLENPLSKGGHATDVFEGVEEAACFPIVMTKEEIIRDCQSILSSQDSCQHAVINAFSSLALLQCTFAQPSTVVSQAREIVSSDKIPVLVRTAAMGYLASCKKEKDKPLWESLAKSPDKRLSFPAVEILRRYYR